MSRIGRQVVRCGAVLATSLWCVALAASAQESLEAQRRDLMPLPQSVVWRGAPLALDRGFTVSLAGPRGGVEPRVERAVQRFLDRLKQQTGIPQLGERSGTGTATLSIEYLTGVPEVQRAIEDESYTLDVDAGGAVLRAPTPYGVLRGLETFLQLVESRLPEASDSVGERAAAIEELPGEPEDFMVPGVGIVDAPRYPWRGLLIDPGRHFISLDVMRRNLDAMAAVKLNVLHWHLSEDQGFRVESKVFPRLHELGSDGQYYTQDEIRELIAYARDRGIRVMPEFDMPGHATSWFVGYPELASAPGPYEIIETWGIQDPAMDPTRQEIYEFLDAFIAEMAALFPDPYFHIGGDEVNGRQWDANADIQQYILDNDLVDNEGLQTHFNRRLQPSLVERGKNMVGWDEIFQPGLPAGTVVHSWRGPEALAAAARDGYPGILSNGYYIDLMYPAADHYAVDPLGGAGASLDADQRRLVYGGEATMWGEYVVDETIDSRIWPRTAAIAERLWSPETVVEVDDMYRRLQATSMWLETTGVRHRSGYEPMLARLAGDPDGVPTLRTLADVVEPIKRYTRGRTRRYTRFTPLNRLVDAARPESDVARHFGELVDAYLESRSTAATTAVQEHEQVLRRQLEAWRDNDGDLQRVAARSAMLPEAGVLSRQLKDVAEVGLEVLDDLAARRTPSGNAHAQREQRLEGAEQQHGALQIMVVAPVRRLATAAREGR